MYAIIHARQPEPIGLKIGGTYGTAAADKLGFDVFEAGPHPNGDISRGLAAYGTLVMQTRSGRSGTPRPRACVSITLRAIYVASKDEGFCWGRGCTYAPGGHG